MDRAAAGFEPQRPCLGSTAGRIAVVQGLPRLAERFDFYRRLVKNSVWGRKWYVLGRRTARLRLSLLPGLGHQRRVLRLAKLAQRKLREHIRQIAHRVHLQQTARPQDPVRDCRALRDRWTTMQALHGPVAHRKTAVIQKTHQRHVVIQKGADRSPQRTLRRLHLAIRLRPVHKLIVELILGCASCRTDRRVRRSAHPRVRMGLHRSLDRMRAPDIPDSSIRSGFGLRILRTKVDVYDTPPGCGGRVGPQPHKSSRIVRTTNRTHRCGPESSTEVVRFGCPKG